VIWYGASWRKNLRALIPAVQALPQATRWLFSYYALRNAGTLADALAWPYARFLDSGAFSAYSQGKPLDVGAYIRFCHKHRSAFEVMAVLDVIGCPTQTAANLRSMRAEGLDPLPVWHITSPLHLLRGMVESETYIAIGGMVGMPTVKRERLLRMAWDIIAPHNTRVHGFGLTRWQDLVAFPWYSCDSSTCAFVATVGRILVQTGPCSYAQRGYTHAQTDAAPRGASADVFYTLASVLSMHAVLAGITAYWSEHSYIPGSGAVPHRVGGTA
jgi:hypothetical protein